MLQAYSSDDPPQRLRADADVVYKSVFAAFFLYTLAIYWVSACVNIPDFGIIYGIINSIPVVVT